MWWGELCKWEQQRPRNFPFLSSSANSSRKLRTIPAKKFRIQSIQSRYKNWTKQPKTNRHTCLVKMIGWVIAITNPDKNVWNSDDWYLKQVNLYRSCSTCWTMIILILNHLSTCLTSYFYQRILKDSLTCYLWPPEMWYSSGDENRSRQTWLSADASSYLHRNVRYAPQIRGRIMQNSFITLGHLGYFNSVVSE